MGLACFPANAGTQPSCPCHWAPAFAGEQKAR
jgi:hypothetical protein